MEIKLDKNNPIPISIQVKEQIKMLINSGVYKEGDKLPSITELANSLKVNKNTIVALLKDLENEAYVKSHRGKGVFVNKKQKNSIMDEEFLLKVDRLIREAAKRGLGAREVLNLVSARFPFASEVRNIRVLFVMGFSQELVDLNIQKIKQNISGIEIDGLFVSKELTRSRMLDAFDWADLIIIPAIAFDSVKGHLPKDKPIVKTTPNLKLISHLKKSIDKKSRIAVIGLTKSSAQAISNMFILEKLFRPRLTLPLNEVEKYRKDLKDVESYVICISAREAVERFKLKSKDVYFFSDYLSDQSMDDIRLALKNIR